MLGSIKIMDWIKLFKNFTEHLPLLTLIYKKNFFNVKLDLKMIVVLHVILNVKILKIINLTSVSFLHKILINKLLPFLK